MKVCACSAILLLSNSVAMAALNNTSTSTTVFPELREKATITYGDECLEKAIEVIEAFGLPGGLLPLGDIVEAGYVEETGFVWIITKRKQEYHFKKADRRCSYAEQVTCYMEKNRMRNIKGVKARDLVFWVPISEIAIDDKNPNLLYFKSIAGIGRALPAQHFGRGS